MTFLISFGVAILFVLACGKRLKAKPVPFYMGAVVIAVAVAAVTWSGLALPPWFARVIWPVFARGGLAGSLFILVMFAGALPNGSRPIKRLMPIRGPLSILASILTLGHNAAYGKVYFLKLFADPASLPVNQLLAAVCSLLMLVIMLPLFVTSFLTVRRKMPPKRWKALQRWAYLFYFLLGAHLLLLSVPEGYGRKARLPAHRFSVWRGVPDLLGMPGAESAGGEGAAPPTPGWAAGQSWDMLYSSGRSYCSRAGDRPGKHSGSPYG